MRRRFKNSSLEVATVVTIRAVPPADGGWEVLFRLPGRQSVWLRVWKKRNEPRSFKTLDAAASFLMKEGVGTFVVSSAPDAKLP
jgi:hypothetical protein